MRRSRIVWNRRPFAIVIALLLASVAAAGTKEITSSPDLPQEIRIPVIESPGEIDVTWEPQDPTLKYHLYELQTGETVFSFDGEPGKKYIVVSDVIDWLDKDREKTTWIVTVEGERKPDKPVDPDEPDPKPEPELKGLAKEVYEYARKVDRPDEARQLAENFRAVYSAIAAGGIKTKERAAEEIKRLNAPLKPSGHWNKFGLWLGGVLNKLNDLDDIKKVFGLISDGLEAAA